MALADITLVDSKTSPVTHTMAFVSMQGNRVLRSDMAASPEEPLTLTLAHQASVVKGAKATSHLARIDTTILDSDGITPLTANVRVMLDIPNAILSDALVDDLHAMIVDWLGSESEFRAFARGSVG